MLKEAVLSGQSGFIGSHLAEALSARGFRVQRVTQELLYSPVELNKFFNKVKPDYIFHLAAYGNMSHQKDVSMTVFANIIGIFNMLKESAGVPYKAFINFGSSSEYGRKPRPMNEQDRLDPETFYGASKAGGTLLAHAFAKQHNLPVVTVRPFSVYGENEADFRFIPTVIRSMLSRSAFPLDESATHDWVYIQDFIEGTLAVAENVHKFPEGIVNIGSGRAHTNKEVCEMLKKISGLQYLATPLPNMRANDSEVWVSDNSLISQRVGFYPKFMLGEGLSKTYEYYKKRYQVTP